MNVLKFFYSVYALIMFTIVFLFWSPFLLFGVWFKSLSKPALRLKHIIAKSFMLSIFMPYSIQYNKKIDFNKQYVIIANHFSFFDIPAFVAINIPMKLIGKMDVSNIPLLGYIFKGLHIYVDRKDKESRKKTYIKSYKAVDEGFNVGVFPEGGIKTNKVPEMAEFKDGAFAIALKKRIPILPVSLLDAYRIMQGSFLLSWHKCRVICHEPISPEGYSIENLEEFKKKCYDILDSKLRKGFLSN